MTDDYSFLFKKYVLIIIYGNMFKFVKLKLIVNIEGMKEYIPDINLVF